MIQIDSLLAIKPPFDIHSGLSHFALARNYSSCIVTGKGFKIYIYKDGIQIPGSPFDSFPPYVKPIGLKSVSSIRNYRYK